MRVRRVILALLILIIGVPLCITAQVDQRGGGSGVVRAGSGGATLSELNVYPITDKAYGAKCNGVNDDTTAIQAAVNAAAATSGTVILPLGHCVISSPVIVGNNASAYTTVNFLGQGANSSFINYTGATNATAALQLLHYSYSVLQGFTIIGPSPVYNGGQGTVIGVLLDGCNPSCGGGTLSTTNLFLNVGFANWNVGLQAGNSVAASEMTCDGCLFTANNDGFIDVSSNSLNFWFFYPSLNNNNCGITSNSDSVSVWGGDSANSFVADFCINSSAFGTFTVAGFRAEVGRTGAHFIGTHNGSYSNAGVTIRDCNIIAAAATETSVITHSSALYITNSTITGLIDMSTADGSVVNILNSLVLYSGNYPVVLPATTTFGIFLKAYGNQAARPFNTPANPACQSNGDYLCYPSDINIMLTTAIMQMPWEAPGTERVKLSGGTASVVFARTATNISVVNGSSTLTYAAGTITGADVRKFISVTGAATPCNPMQADNVTGYIGSILSSTTAQIVLLPDYAINGLHQCHNGFLTGTYSATIGTVMPNADYAVGLSSDTSGETYAISSKTATGFTVTSSNGASTANVDLIVGRFQNR